MKRTADRGNSPGKPEGPAVCDLDGHPVRSGPTRKPAVERLGDIELPRKARQLPDSEHTGKVIFSRDRAGEVRFSVRARNGRTVGPTEGFGSPSNAHRGLDALRRALVNPLIVDLT